MSYEVCLSPLDVGNTQTDDDYLAKAFAAAIASPKRVVLDTTARPFTLRRPLTLSPQGTETQATIDVYALRKGSAWPSFEYRGPKGEAAVRVVGMKGASVRKVLVRNWTPGAAAGWYFGTDARFGSHSGGVYEQLGFVDAGGSEAGFLVGDDTRLGAGPADMSCNTFSRCYANGAGLTKHGVWQFGGNTCDMLYSGLAVSAVTGYAVRVEGHPWNKYTNSGGTLFEATDVSTCQEAFHIAGGSTVSVFGGRVEKCKGAAVHVLAGGAPGLVTVSGLCVDSAALPYVADGSTRVVWLTSPPATA